MTPACPACGASGADVRYREKHDDWFCDACDHSWRAASPATEAAPATPPTPAFISYGHADATDFVRRLKADLEARGVNPVWLDSEMLGGGTLWTVGIEHGIREAGALLAIVTRHGLREDSICHDEVALAATEEKRVVPLRVEPDPVLRPSLLLVRRSWVDFTFDYDAAL